MCKRIFPKLSLEQFKDEECQPIRKEEYEAYLDALTQGVKEACEGVSITQLFPNCSEKEVKEILEKISKGK